MIFTGKKWDAILESIAAAMWSERSVPETIDDEERIDLTERVYDGMAEYLGDRAFESAIETGDLTPDIVHAIVDGMILDAVDTCEVAA